MTASILHSIAILVVAVAVIFNTFTLRSLMKRISRLEERR